MAYTKYSLTPANNNAAPPDGAPEGMLPSAVNDTMRDMMAQIRDVGDGIRGGTYTMTAPVITGGSITGVALSGNTLTNPVITGGSINNTTVGATTRSTGAFTTLASNGATTFTAGTASTSTTTGTAVITGGLGVSGRINAANFDGIVGANTAAAGNFTTLGASSTATLNTLASSGATLTGGSINGMAIGGTTAAAGKFTTLEATGVTTVQAGTVSAPAITTTGDTNTGIFFPAADTIAFTEGGVEAMRIDSSGNVGIGTSSPTEKLQVNGNIITTSLRSNSFIEIRSDSAAFYFENAANNRYYLTQLTGSSSSPDIATYYYNGTSSLERMRINASGNVGIGLTSPAAKLDVLQEARVSLANGSTYFTSITNTDGNTRITANGASGFLALGTEGTEKMRIASGGNVGIGTTSPSYALDVTRGASTGVSAKFGRTGGQAGYIYTDTNSTFFASNPSVTQGLQFNETSTFAALFVNSAERMRIDSSGVLLVGTTSNTSFAGKAVFSVNGNTDNGVCVSVANAAGGNALTFFNSSNASVGSIATTASATSFRTSTTGAALILNGVQFPATQSASADANTLDDYEEGTWTPVFTAATPGDLSVTYSFQNGKYTKVGNLVTVKCFIFLTAFTFTTASGDLRITGLPFVASSDVNDAQGAIALRSFTRANYTNYTAAVFRGASYANVSLSGSGQDTATLAITNYTSGASPLPIIVFTVTYTV